jgi:4'-phosphopantetheinyl transferase EntD
VILESLAAVLPPAVVVEWLAPLPSGLSIHPAEALLVAGAAERRQREFAAGRWLAARALQRLGQAPAPLLTGPGREPRWPRDIVGSISHDGGACIVVAARSAEIRAIGIDLDRDAPLDRDLWESVCSARELAWLLTQPATGQGRLARLLFSAKEAFYKFQYPLTGAFLEFGDVEVALPLAPHELLARLILVDVPGAAAGFEARGLWVSDGAFIATIFFERAPGAATGEADGG